MTIARIWTKITDSIICPGLHDSLKENVRALNKYANESDPRLSYYGCQELDHKLRMVSRNVERDFINKEFYPELYPQIEEAYKNAAEFMERVTHNHDAGTRTRMYAEKIIGKIQENIKALGIISEGVGSHEAWATANAELMRSGLDRHGPSNSR